MPQGKSPSTQLVLLDHAGLGRLHIDMEAFFEFSFWLAEELEDLVAHWKHTAHPLSDFQRGGISDDRRL